MPESEATFKIELIDSTEPAQAGGVGQQAQSRAAPPGQIPPAPPSPPTGRGSMPEIPGGVIPVWIVGPLPLPMSGAGGGGTGGGGGGGGGAGGQGRPGARWIRSTLPDSPDPAFVEDQLTAAAESMRMLAIGQLIGATGLPGAQVAHFAFARSAMQNEMKRESDAARDRLMRRDPSFAGLTKAEQDERVSREPGVVGAGMQSMMSTAGMVMSIIQAVDQAISKIGEAVANFYRAETAVMVGQLRERGSAIAFDVAGHARSQISTEQARLAQDRMALRTTTSAIPVVGSLVDLIAEGAIFRGRERELAEREQVLQQVGIAEQQFRTFSQFNPGLATQAAMQDVGRLFRTMDQAERLGSVYGEFSEQLFQHEATMQETFAQLMPGMMGDLMTSFRQQSERQLAETMADARIAGARARIASGGGTAEDFMQMMLGFNREGAISRALEEIRSISVNIDDMAERERRRERTTEVGLLSLRAPGEGRGVPEYEAAREAPTAAMRRASMEVPAPGIDIP